MCDHDPNDQTALRHPAAPISAQEIAELRCELATARDARDADFLLYAAASARRMPRLLDAIEALADENARLNAECDRYAADAFWPVTELKAELERLEANVIDLSDQLKLEETWRIMREIEDEDELRRLRVRDDDDRRRVEADHAAKKEGGK